MNPTTSTLLLSAPIAVPLAAAAVCAAAELRSLASRTPARPDPAARPPRRRSEPEPGSRAAVRAGRAEQPPCQGGESAGSAATAAHAGGSRAESAAAIAGGRDAQARTANAGLPGGAAAGGSGSRTGVAADGPARAATAAAHAGGPRSGSRTPTPAAAAVAAVGTADPDPDSGSGPAETAAGRASDRDAAAPAPRLSGWAGLVSPAAILVAAGRLAGRVPGGGPVDGCGGMLRADALTVWMLLVIGAVGALALAASPAYLAGERAAGHAGDRTVRRYYALVHAFLAAMCLAVLAADLGVLWVAIEATTIVTAFLVGHRRTRASVEAAWKYVVICSAGIALAFLGTVLVYYAARQAGVPEASALDWPTLVAHADRLDPSVTRLGIGLIVIGFGAKAGLMPLHAWLPDAHGQAPAPVSALMSGVLLAVSFTALLRYKVIADAALGTGYARTLLTVVALATLALAAAMLLAQRDYKRMLAYSSMEHMSLIALGAAVGGPLAMSAVLLHVAGHGLAKTAAFTSSGHIVQLAGRTRIGRVRGLLARSPALGALFGLAVLALLGLPPFSLFASEVGVVRAGFGAGLGWTVSLALVLVLVAYAALGYRTGRMVLGPAPGPAGPPPAAGPARGSARQAPVRPGRAAVLPPAAGLLACAALGTALGPLTHLLDAAAAIVGGR